MAILFVVATKFMADMVMLSKATANPTFNSHVDGNNYPLHVIILAFSKQLSHFKQTYLEDIVASLQLDLVARYHLAGILVLCHQIL